MIRKVVFSLFACMNDKYGALGPSVFYVECIKSVLN